MTLKFVRTDVRSLIGIALTATLLLAFGRAWTRTQTTLIGYELGELKDREATLLEQRSHLQMELAKLTTRAHLSLLAHQSESGKTVGTLASH